MKPKKRISNVVTFKMSDKILEVSDLDNVIANLNDLILKCLSAFFKSTARAKKYFKHSDVALIWLCNELHFCASKGHILKLDTVWN